MKKNKIHKKKVYRSDIKLKVFNCYANNITNRDGETYSPTSRKFEFYLQRKSKQLETRIKKMSTKFKPDDFYWATAERAAEMADLLDSFNKIDSLEENTPEFLRNEKNKRFYAAIVKTLNECADWLKEKLPNEKIK